MGKALTANSLARATRPSTRTILFVFFFLTIHFAYYTPRGTRGTRDAFDTFDTFDTSDTFHRIPCQKVKKEKTPKKTNARNKTAWR